MARRKRSDMEEGGEDAAADRPARERHLRVPPPLTEGNEAFEGGDILEELEGELGGLLWNSLRSVTLWARAAADRRAAMAAPEAAARRLDEIAALSVPPAIATALETLALVLAEPGTVQGASVSGACRTVAEWANAEGMVGTALAFLQAAALARPDDPGLSYAVGRMARRHGEPTRAESWLQHAIVQARRKEDWETYTLVYAGLGNLYAERGNFPAGRRALTRALRTAQRHSLRKLEGESQHDLFAIAAETGRVREAERLAAATLDIYGKGHRRLPYLAQDLAFLWVERGLSGAALSVVNALRPHIRGFPERMLLLSNAARAAAGVGDREHFERAWAETEQEVPPVPFREGVAAALLNLAIGAEMLGDLERARDAGSQAVQVARRTREGKVRLTAEALVERVAAGKPKEAPGALPERSRERSEKLAGRFEELLGV